MRIALLHSFYSSAQSSGENVVVLEQFEALREVGVEVLLVSRSTDAEVQRRGYPLRAAWQTLTNTGPDPSARLRRFAPDVVHIHNTVPNIGLQWLADWDGPIVHTLHNFRPMCANGLLFRDGRICTDCPDGAPWAAVEHACYRESRVATLPVAARNARGLAANPLLERADALVVLSDFARRIYTTYGVDPGRVELIPNGVSTLHSAPSSPPPAQRWVAVGRLRQEKGLAELLAAWPEALPLDVIGEGPQRPVLEQLAGPHVRLLGEVPVAELRASLGEYTGLAFPSLAPESAMPLSVVEALEAGIPVVMTDRSPHASTLEQAGVARTFRADEDGRIDPVSLASTLVWAHEGGAALRSRVRQIYLSEYTRRIWVERLLDLYARLSGGG